MTRKRGRGSIIDVAKARGDAKKKEHKKLSAPSGAMKGASASANTVKRAINKAIKGGTKSGKATVASRIKDSKVGAVAKQFKKDHPVVTKLAKTLDKATKRDNVASMQAVKNRAAAKRHPNNKKK